MKKKLIALAVLGAVAGMAQAQSSVTLYGSVDTGFIKESGTSTRMDENAANVLGFKGQEDLGGGLKATFQIEQQFLLNSGETKPTEGMDDKIHEALGSRGTVSWLGAANVGLEGEWGHVRFGRMSDMLVDNYTMIDPFEQGGTAAALSKFTRLRSEQLSNTARYDSPEFNGFSFSGAYTLGADDRNATVPSRIFNDGFAGSIKYENGPILAMANYSRQADSDNSSVWNVGGAYTFGPARVSLGYQSSKVKDLTALGADFVDSPMDQNEWLLGFQYEVGAGTINASYNRGKIKNIPNSGSADKYALGYTYKMSKRTSLYAMASYTDSDNDFVGSIYNNNHVEKDSVTGVQFGITHNF